MATVILEKYVSMMRAFVILCIVRMESKILMKMVLIAEGSARTVYPALIVLMVAV
jgi:hypothetical protein